MAEGRLNAMAMEFVTGDGLTAGRTDLRPGGTIEVEGIGDRFSGAYYVVWTEHAYHPAIGYQTRFSVRRNAIG